MNNIRELLTEYFFCPKIGAVSKNMQVKQKK